MATVPAAAQAKWGPASPAPQQSQQVSQPGTAPCSDACSGGGYTSAPTGEIGIPPTLGVVGAAELAAMHAAEVRPEGALSQHLASSGHYSTAELNAYAATAHPTAAVTPANPSPSDAFDWTDAAIGAGIAATIALLMTFTAVGVRGRRQARQS
jgi:hypothetical protein